MIAVSQAKIAAEKNAMRVAKVRKREKARKRRLRTLDTDMDAAELYDDFIGHEGRCADVEVPMNLGDDEEAKMLWDNLLPPPSTNRFQHCECSPRNVFYRDAKKSMLDRLGG